MGYTTEFEGALTLTPGLTMEQYAMLCALHDDQKALPGRPGVLDGYCQWQPSKDGKSLAWDQGEKFYDYVEWLEYICEWLAGCKVAVNGSLKFQGEDKKDRGVLVVKDNVVTKGVEPLVVKGRTRLATARGALEKIAASAGDEGFDFDDVKEIAKAALEAIK